MIRFKKIVYRNLLASGHAWTTVTLDSHPHTLIVGTNGCGKTTLLDALCFALYGKPFRSIAKGTLINSVNQKDLVVEVEFETQNRTYVVRRGLKPNVFTITCEGQLIPELPSSNDYQEHLEKYILQCNYKSFTSVVILGAASYVPFMRLTPTARREIIEQLLDINVFSTMQSLLKDRLSATKDTLSAAQQRLAVIESQHALMQTYADRWTTEQETKRRALEIDLSGIKVQQAMLASQRETLLTDIESVTPHAEKVSDLQKKLTKATSIVSKVIAQLQHATHRRRFFTDHAQCPMCEQGIGGSFKDEHVTTLEAQVEKLTTDRAEAETLVDRLQRKLGDAEQAAQVLRQYQTQRTQLEAKITSLEREADRLTREHAATFDPPPPPPTDIGDRDAAEAAVQAVQYEKHVLEQGSVLLKDNGIRTKIIKHYLPTINKYVNRYLQALNFPIQFVLDDQFNETIKSRYRDVFSYENFSEGEKRRIDLALLLTWRAIARMKNSVSTNLLIFDEIVDGSLDAAGIDDFMSIIESLGLDTNVFIISHKEAMMDKFSRTLSVTKEKGFSVTRELA